MTGPAPQTHHWDDGEICIYCGESYDLACQSLCIGRRCSRCGDAFRETPEGCRDPDCPLAGKEFSPPPLVMEDERGETLEASRAEELDYDEIADLLEWCLDRLPLASREGAAMTMANVESLISKLRYRAALPAPNAGASEGAAGAEQTLARAEAAHRAGGGQ